MKWLKLLSLALQWIAIQSTKPEDKTARREDRLLREMWETGKQLFAPEVTKLERDIEKAATLDDLLDDADDNTVTAFLGEKPKLEESKNAEIK